GAGDGLGENPRGRAQDRPPFAGRARGPSHLRRRHGPIRRPRGPGLDFRGYGTLHPEGDRHDASRGRALHRGRRGKRLGPPRRRRALRGAPPRPGHRTDRGRYREPDRWSTGGGGRDEPRRQGRTRPRPFRLRPEPARSGDGSASGGGEGGRVRAPRFRGQSGDWREDPPRGPRRMHPLRGPRRGGRQGRDRERATRRVSSAVVEHAVEAVLLRGLLEPPENRELVPALLALVVLAQVPAGDVEPVPFDRDRAAARTVRVLETMARDVPDVDVLQARLLGDRAVLLEGIDGSPGELHHLVIRMEPEEMDRGIGTEVVVYPLRKLPRGPEIVADLGHDEVRDLDVDLLRVPRVEDRLENRIGVRDVDVLPDEIRFSRAFEVHRDAVEELRHLRHRLRCVVAVRDEDVDQPGLAREHTDVSGELDEDRWLIVGVREALASLFQGHAHDILRLDLDAFDFSTLGDVCILTIAAVVN